MAKAIQIKPEEALARAYADRLILHKLTELQSVVKLSEISDDLSKDGLGLASVRALLASNPHMFAYNERRWVPASRVDGEGRPFAECVRLVVDRFGGPMPIELVVRELSLLRELEESYCEDVILRLAETDDNIFMTFNKEIALRAWVWSGYDQTIDAALRLHKMTPEELESTQKKLEGFDWHQEGAIGKAMNIAAPVSVKVLGAICWMSVNTQDPRSPMRFFWRKFNAEVLSVEGFVYGPDGMMTPEADAKKWISAAVKLAERIAPTVEIEDAQPIEVKSADLGKMAAKIIASDDSVTATKLLEEFYEITPSVKTFPDDLANVINGLKADSSVWWVGGDRFRKPKSAPEFVYSVPELFDYIDTEMVDEDGDYVDSEITDEGLSTTLRKLLSHPLATDVLDEEILPLLKQQPDQIRVVLKSIHRELGTFPMSQVPTGWLEEKPGLQELIFVDPTGRELQVWMNTDARLMFNLLDWFFEQPVESGAVFTLAKTAKPNVFEFSWLDQSDPVVFISVQRMEELRDIQAASEGKSTLQLLQEVMSHWPKGADFLTILWELNVVRRSKRRLTASLLTNYHCFYQRSGSPVWHYDAKKVEQGFDKTKKKFIIKR
ncbi:MAG: hypothetical protein K8R88_07710 [Armatimonadetes bacterium]|nr:hypothetical protein [Armatimonadota bacterium]